MSPFLPAAASSTASQGLCLLGLGGLIASAFVLHAGDNVPETEQKGRGVFYVHNEIEDGPWSIHVLKIDRSRKDLKLHAALAGGTTAIGGGPALVRAGKIAKFSTSLTSWFARHPRSALGWNDQFIFLVVVDGRQLGVSVGMTLPELSSYLIKLGCREAMNFDGGGSSTLWAFGQVINRPCEGFERPMANALVLVQEPKTRAAAPPAGAVAERGEQPDRRVPATP